MKINTSNFFSGLVGFAAGIVSVVITDFLLQKSNARQPNYALEEITELRLIDQLLEEYPTDRIDGQPSGILNLAGAPEREIYYDPEGITYRFCFYRLSHPTDTGVNYFFCIILKYDEINYSTIRYALPAGVETAIRLSQEVQKQLENELTPEEQIQAIFSLIKAELVDQLIVPSRPEDIPDDKTSANAAPVGIGDVVESQPDLGCDLPEFELEDYQSAIGYILYSNQDDESELVCTAFLVGQDMIMTARHALSNLVPNRLLFCLPNVNAQQEFPIDHVVEDATTWIAFGVGHPEILPDYALLKIKNEQALQLKSLKLSDEELQYDDRLYKVIGVTDLESGLQVQEVRFAHSDSQVPLVINYYSNTQPGFSGAPFIDLRSGAVIGMQCKTTLQPIAANERTAMSIQYLIETYPASELSALLPHDDIPITQVVVSSSPPDFSDVLEGGTSISALMADRPLSEFTTVCEGFLEREEAKKKKSQLRMFGLGATPGLGNTHTYRCLLARWLLKGEEKIKFKPIVNDSTRIVYDQKNQSYKITIRIDGVNRSMVITKDQLEKQSDGKGIAPTTKRAAILINNFFAPEFWEVCLKEEKEPKNAAYHTRAKWVKLTELVEGEKRSYPAINMGHKLSAIEYWKKGSEEYKTKRLDEKERSAKYAHKVDLFNKKKKEYEERYDKYQTAGYFSYGMSINEDFMRDPKNYRFEWHSRNKSAGGREQGVFGVYSESCPPGLESKDDQRFVPA